MSFIVVIGLIGLLLVAEPQEPNYLANAAEKNQNCYVNIEPSGLITVGQKHGEQQTTRKEGECVFRADVIKDYWDYALIGFTIVLTGALVWIGWLTKQVNKSAAESARKQGDLIVAIERPWISVKPIPVDPLDWPFIQNGPAVSPPFRLKLKWTARNSGRSPAFLTDLSINFRCIPLPKNEIPDYYKFAGIAKMIIDPNGGSHDHEDWLVIEQSDLDSILDGTKCVAFYGYAEYYDTINKTPRKTRFYCYWRIFNSNMPWALHYEPVGPDETIEYT